MGDFGEEEREGMEGRVEWGKRREQRVNVMK